MVYCVHARIMCTGAISKIILEKGDNSIFLKSFIYSICTRSETQFRRCRFLKMIISMEVHHDYRDSLIVGASSHPPLGGSVAHWAGRRLDSYNADS